MRESVAITADEALKLKVIDLVAANQAELLEKVDGRKVKVAGAERTLATAGAEVRRIEMSLLAALPARARESRTSRSCC